MQEWLRFVQVKCLQEKDSEAGVVEVCACLMLAWEGSRRRSEWGLCRFDASMRRIQTQEWVIFFCRFDACMRRIQTQKWVNFSQVWCLYEKDSDARVSEVCAGLMLVWEGFRRQSGRGLCRFDARMLRIETQDWVRFVQVWCLYEKDSDAGVGEVCAGLMQAWERFRHRSGWGLRMFDASMRRIQTQEWVRFVQVWILYEKESDAGVGEVCAGLMILWEGFRRRSGWGLCRFDASMREIQTQAGVMFVQVFCSYRKDSNARMSAVCAGLMLVWKGIRCRVVEVCAG